MTETETTVDKPQIPERILIAAARVMEREGFATASLREIAAEAGMTKAGLYYHVPSKEFLLYALHERFASKLRDYSERVASADLTATEKLHELVKQTVTTAATYQAEGTVFLREYGRLTGDMAAAISAERDRFRQLIEKVIDDGIAAGEFRAGTPYLDTLAILGACNFTAFWFNSEGPLKIEDIAESFADRLIYGMSAPDTDKGDRA